MSDKGDRLQITGEQPFHVYVSPDLGEEEGLTGRSMDAGEGFADCSEL